MMIKENIEKVRQRISRACLKRNIDAGRVTLCCVTKGRSIEEIQEAVEAGIDCLGENRVQEARLKYKLIPQAHWQMVGHLQSNKVKDALEIFDLIHSVDSVELASQINRQAIKLNKVQDILLEVKTSDEASKTGFDPEVLAREYKRLAAFEQIRIKGLMTIAARGDSPQSARPYFAKLRLLRDQLNCGWLLSMGMSDDFEVAIEEGADIIRVGRAIFQDHV